MFNFNTARFALERLVLCGLSAYCLAAIPAVAAASDANPEQSGRLDEIVVTAQKREERLQDVPVPVTALSAQTLADTGQMRLADYYSSVPGLNFAPNDQGGAGGTLTIRGLNSGGGNPTVAILIDGIPFGSSTALGSGSSIPDLDPSDLQRIEVLRGPQGTLYGGNSLGGIVNFVTAAPSTDALSGHVQVDLGSVYGGSGPGYGWRGSINVPLSDTMAIRASAFTRHDAGYVDNIQTGQSGVNWGDTSGGRLMGLWRPNETVSLQLGALLQNSTQHGDSQVFLAPGFGDLQQSALRGTGGIHQSIQGYSAVLKAKIGTFDLASLTSYGINQLQNSYDFSQALGPYIPASFGTSAVNLFTNSRSEDVTEEVRLSTRFADKLEWLIGGFYTHQSVPDSQVPELANETTGAAMSAFANFDWRTTYEEYAAFTDLTVHFTDQFDVQLGGRESFITQHYQETDSGPYVVLFDGEPSPTTFPAESSDQSVFTYLVTPRFKLSEHFMAYARIASGYRPGGPNANDIGALAAQVPPAFGADRTKNYELGVKGDAFDRRLTFDASIYYIDWKNIQLNLFNASKTLAYFGNAAGAKSQGVEVSVESRPVDGLTLGAWAAWNDAQLTEGIPTLSPSYGASGDVLPFSARFSGNVSLQQEFQITGQVTGFVGGVMSYLGEREGAFLGKPPEANPRQVYPAYAKTDLRAGTRFNDWTMNLFVNNVADKRGLLSGGAGTPNPQSFAIIQPRTLGLSVDRKF